MNCPGPRRYRADFLTEWAYLQWLDRREKAIAAREKQDTETRLGAVSMQVCDA